MKVATVALAYHEERLIGPHLQHIPSWVNKRLVMVSLVPWQGAEEPDVPDHTRRQAMLYDPEAEVYEYTWGSEDRQRNAAQEILYDYDWIIVLDPDEFMARADWERLHRFLMSDEAKQYDAYVAGTQLTYWKRGMRIEPSEDYRQIIAVRPGVRFVDKRVVNCAWGYAPIVLHHLSWARTDEEIWRKTTHYSHAHEFDAKKWYDEVWCSTRTTDLHPLTPESLKQAIPAELPAELEALGLRLETIRGR